MKTYDHIVIGTGQALGVLLEKLIPTGESIAVIEGHKVGGSCVNYGCTPTKAMVASAKAIHQAQRGDEFGFSTGPVTIDYVRVRERMNHIRNAGNEGLTEWMEATENIDFLRGWGTFTGPRQVRVDEQHLEGKHIYINTGTYAFIPPIDGINQVPYLDSEGLLDLKTQPEHLLITGGGYVGVEFAQIYRRFGSEVTIIEYEDQLMPHEDEDVAQRMQAFLEREGISVMLGGQVNQATQRGDTIHLQVKQGDQKHTLTGSHLLVATGRRPSTNRLNLDQAGIKTTDRGYIAVDDYCRTNIEGVFAVGDVNGQGAFTHTSVNDAEIVLDHLFGGSRKLSDRIPIYGVFTDPPLGRVGLTEKAALEAGKNVLAATLPMSKISRAKEMSETTGFTKLLVDADTDLILGASILGPGGDEIINMLATIMYSNIPCQEYRKVVLVHPTVSELMPWILDGLEPVA